MKHIYLKFRCVDFKSLHVIRLDKIECMNQSISGTQIKTNNRTYLVDGYISDICRRIESRISDIYSYDEYDSNYMTVFINLTSLPPISNEAINEDV